jgi:hypothetical protein
MSQDASIRTNPQTEKAITKWMVVGACLGLAWVLPGVSRYEAG